MPIETKDEMPTLNLFLVNKPTNLGVSTMANGKIVDQWNETANKINTVIIKRLFLSE